ncbi:MAG: radical SAM protein [Ruminococcaceae bacterium]|nr:radical SAM protein [Oscillospiraceae bacterium]
MKASKRELAYAARNFNEVHHTTLDPEGPGVVRIHLIPPKVSDGEIGASIAILNGQDVVPVNTSWSILLTEFIKAVNEYSGREVSDEDVEHIVAAACTEAKKVYPLISRKRMENDIRTIMRTFRQVAYGEETDTPIEYLTMGEYAPRMRAPHRMDLMVSAMTAQGRWHCNQQCVHCYAAGQTAAEESELTTQEWKQILDRCRAACIPQVTFTGGEPTMREDLLELIDYAKWFITRLNTNGIRLTEEYCRKLHAASLDSVQITFYSADEQIHDRLVGGPHFRETVAGIENALAAGLSLSVNTPLCTLNRDYVSTLRFLHERGVRYVTCSGLITTGNAAKEASEQLQLTNAEVRDILRESVRYCFANGMEISFTSPGWVDAEFCAELGITTPNCGACLSNMAITPGGNVAPCQSWLSGEPLGHMLRDDWETIWNGARCRERREFSAQLRCECPLRILRTEKGREA